MTTRRALVLSLACCLLAVSCPRPAPTATGKIVCLVPSVTEIIYALGQQKQLAGNTTFCNYPESAKNVYKVGDFSNPSVEKILALKPGLVFATLPEQQSVVGRLQQMKIKVFVSRPNGIDSLFREIRSIGTVLGVPARADSLVDSLKNRLARIPRLVPRPSVYLEIAEQPLMTVGRGSFVNEIVERAGGRNTFVDIDKEYPVVSQEQVIARDPDVILLLHPMRDRTEFGKRLGWNRIAAVRNGQVFDDVDPDIVLRPGPRVVEGIEAIALRLGAR